jgi:hypothetical protein
LKLIASNGCSSIPFFATPSCPCRTSKNATPVTLAYYQGTLGARIGPGSLGAAFFIPTVLVPPLLIVHGLIFRLLLRP